MTPTAPPATPWGGCADHTTSEREKEVLASSGAEVRVAERAAGLHRPQGEAASVAISRTEARGESLGSLLFNPGDPGGSGVLGRVAVARGLAGSRISERFDMIGFDPRGVGATDPAADCYTPDGTTRGDEVFPLLTLNASVSPEDTRTVFERCAQESGGEQALLQMDTRTTARDMDVLRAALKKEQLSFLGQSYGTRLGAVYAEQSPQQVETMVLDGAFDPTLGTVERRAAAYAGFRAAFQVMAAKPGPPIPPSDSPTHRTSRPPLWWTSLPATRPPLTPGPSPSPRLSVASCSPSRAKDTRWCRQVPTPAWTESPRTT